MNSPPIKQMVCGVDGCRGGWVAAIKDPHTGTLTVRLFPAFAALTRELTGLAAMAIDIPIGLPESGARECDQAARRLLGTRRGSSVFPAPIRSLLRARSHAEASQRRQRVEGKRVSIQTWNIVAKIRSVDTVMRREPSLRVHEAHPEVSFQTLRGGPLRHGKKTASGRAERHALLRPIFGRSVPQALSRRAELMSGADDILDAFVLLWTAQRIARGGALSLPPNPPRDRYGLTMAIVA